MRVSCQLEFLGRGSNADFPKDNFTSYQFSYITWFVLNNSPLFDLASDSPKRTVSCFSGLSMLISSFLFSPLPYSQLRYLTMMSSLYQTTRPRVVSIV